MNTQQLQCFINVADKLNFTKAAEELYLSPPTVTHHIRSLEEELNTKLFIRTSKMVKLTEAGISFYSDAKEILMKIDISKKHVEKAATRNIIFIRIGCTSNAELNSLSDILSGLQQEYPRVYPVISINDYSQIVNLFINKQIDIMLSTKEMIKDIRNCTFKKIKVLTKYAVMPANSPFSNYKKLTFDDLKDSCLITLHPKLIPFQYQNKIQEKITIHSQQHLGFICENDQVGILLAKAGYGIAIMPEFCISNDWKDIVAIPIQEQDTIEYGIAYQGKPKEKYIKYFIDNFSLPETKL
ncbi:LysR family transcriptional regulator [Heyndrickxia camelliae]|uniref:LysR family transcriptional regulator n=1 Tax=Heyndrickxia camelliae TaxID=1707093 RepID=A0A2N3LHH9_9BACI|nr:LysR family transcriptional regulator [Heyndrickxia camelliae]PKR84080.1 LysR family transcriptional regulator [Heyndrickxia camelliae]